MIDALRRAAEVGRFCSIRGFETKVERTSDPESRNWSWFLSPCLASPSTSPRPCAGRRVSRRPRGPSCPRCRFVCISHSCHEETHAPQQVRLKSFSRRGRSHLVGEQRQTLG